MVNTPLPNPLESLTADDLTPVARSITGDDAASVIPGWTAKRIGKSVGTGPSAYSGSWEKRSRLRVDGCGLPS